MDFVIPADLGENERKIDKYLDLASELKSAVEPEGGRDTNCS